MNRNTRPPIQTRKPNAPLPSGGGRGDGYDQRTREFALDADQDGISNDAFFEISGNKESTLLIGGPPPGSRKKIFFFCGTPTEKVSREGQRFCKTEVAESPIPSHTDVVADHAQRTNCILLHVGISTCLDVGACRILMRMRLRWRNLDSP